MPSASSGSTIAADAGRGKEKARWTVDKTVWSGCIANHVARDGNGGAEGDRTPDLCNAIAALSQLSYGPISVREAAH